MNNSLRLLPLFVLFGFFVVTLLPTQAQTENSIETDLRYAAISISQPYALETQGGGPLSVGATITNSFPETHVFTGGVEFQGVTEDTRQTRYTYRFPEKVVLAGGETKALNFSLPKPLFLEGKYRLSLGMNDRLGNRVAFYPLGEKNFTATGRVIMENCAVNRIPPNEALELSATTPLDLTGSCLMHWTGSDQTAPILKAQITNNLFDTPKVIGTHEPVLLTQKPRNISFTFPAVQIAGTFTLEIVPQIGESVVGVPLRQRVTVTGTGGKISGVTRLATNQSLNPGDTVPVTTRFTLYDAAPYTLLLELLSDGVVCSEPLRATVQTINHANHEIKVTQSCPKPTVRATLASAAGTAVDQWALSDDESQAFQPNKEGDEMTPEPTLVPPWIWWSSFGIIVIVIGALFMRRRQASVRRTVLIPVIAFFMTLSFWGVDTERVQAASVGFTMDYTCASGDPCPRNTRVWYSLSTAKEVYAPGERIDVVMTISSDDNPIGNPNMCPDARLGVNSAGVGSDLVSSCYSRDDFRTGLVFDLSGEPSAPTASGNFTLTFNVGLGGYDTPPNQQVTLNVAVAQPTPTASLSISPTSGIDGTYFTYSLSSSNAGSCEVVRNPGNTTPLPRSANVTGLTYSEYTGSGNWTYTTQCWSGTGTASNIDTDTLNVSAASGNFTSTPSCTIASGQAGCTTTLGWTATSPTTVLTDCGGATLASRGAGSQSAAGIYVPYSSGCYELHAGYAAGTLLARTTVTSACTSGTNWNGSSCAASTAVDGVCGNAHGRTYNIGASTIPVGDRCSSGTYNVANWGSDGGAWYTTTTFDSNNVPTNTAGAEAAYYLGRVWTCDGSNGGVTRGCYLYYQPQCGSANGVGRSNEPPRSNGLEKIALCQIGSASAVNTTACSYDWTCTNGGGPTTNCSAPRIGGVCGAPPTVDITATGPVAFETQKWWQKALSWLGGNEVVAAGNASITTSQNANVSWTSNDAGSCIVSGPLINSTLRNNPAGQNVSGSALGVGTHTYTINCSNANGNASATATVTVSAPGGPPGCPGCGGSGDFISATPGTCGTGTITVDWNDEAGTTYYEIERDGGAPLNTGGTSAYTHSGLVDGSPHSYRARACNGSGCSAAWSNVASTNAPPVCSGSIDGVCAITHNNCNAGTSANPTEDASFWYWQCLGIGAGSNTASCQESKTASTYSIDSSVSGSGGSIAPLGRVSGITAGSSQSYTITPSSGYNINSVVVDGVNRGPLSSYTFTNITANGTIVASFASVSSQVISFGNDGPITPGRTATLSYTVQGWDLCEITRIPQSTTLGGPFPGNLGSGSRLSDNLTTDQTYRLRCWVTATGQQDTRDTTVSVSAGSGSTINVMSLGTNASSFVVRELPFFNGVVALNQGSSYEILTLMGTDRTSTAITQPMADGFSYRWDTTSAWQSISQAWRTVPNPGSSEWDYSSSFSPNRGGIMYLRHCVDETDALQEFNESDNCTERSIFVIGSPSGSLTSFTNPCIIPIGQSSCTFSTAWTTSYVDGSPNAVFVGIRNSTNTLSQTIGFPTPSAYTWPGFVSGPPGTWTVTLTAGSARGSAVLDTRTFDVVCAPGSTWVANLGCQPVPTVTLNLTNTATGASATNGGSLSASPGQNIRLDWTVLDATSCTASGKWTGSKNNLGGTETQSAAVPSGDYVLACTNTAGTTSVQVTLNLACTPSVGPWSACGPPCAGGEGTRTRTRVTAACLSTPEEERCTASVCRDLNWKEVGQ